MPVETNENYAEVTVFHKGEERDGKEVSENRIYIHYQGKLVPLPDQMTAVTEALGVVRGEPGKWVLVYTDESKRLANPWGAAKIFRVLASEISKNGGLICAISKNSLLVDLFNDLLKIVAHIEVRRFDTEAECNTFLTEQAKTQPKDLSGSPGTAK